MKIRRLRAATRPATKRAIDKILTRARRALVRANESLAGADERAIDAEEDARRIVLYARLDGSTVGIVDAELHTPDPGDVTVSQIAVRERARGRGVGKALVAEVLARAEKRAGPDGALVAAVLAGNDRAVAFWEHLGLETVAKDRRTTMLSGAAKAVRDRLAVKE